MINHWFSKNKAGILLVGIVILLSFITFSPAAKRKVKVKTDTVNIHLFPNSKSEIIDKVPLGMILDFEYKRGKWYRVNLPPDKSGIMKSGYIHQDFIEEVSKGKKEGIAKKIIIQEMEKKYEGELVTLKFRNADIRDVITSLCKIGGLNVVFDPGVMGKVTCDLKDVPWDQALDIILKTHKLGKVIYGNVCRTAKIDSLRKEGEDKIRKE